MYYEFNLNYSIEIRSFYIRHRQLHQIQNFLNTNMPILIILSSYRIIILFFVLNWNIWLLTPLQNWLIISNMNKIITSKIKNDIINNARQNRFERRDTHGLMVRTRVDFQDCWNRKRNKEKWMMMWLFRYLKDHD